MYDLNKLAQHRKDILLAEVVGWLHDHRKCSEEFLKIQAGYGANLPRDEIIKRFAELQNLFINLLNENASIPQLWKERKESPLSLASYLTRAHNTSHFDKQEPAGGKQGNYIIHLSTPFGFEKSVPSGLTSALWALPWTDLTDREKQKQAIEPLFSQTVADTRRPINEVNLWSWGMLVGALYKAALAGALLNGQFQNVKDLRWRLLSVRIDGLSFLRQAEKIPDLLARKELISDALNKVQKLLEITSPIASEVYRDENGSIYVVPDLQEDVLENAKADGKALKVLILDAFAEGTLKNDPSLQIGAEWIPHVGLEQKPWWGQDPEWREKAKSNSSSNDELPDIAGILSSKAISFAQTDKIRTYWPAPQPTAEICSVCGIRPQGPERKHADRRVCNICEERRANRAREWLQQQQKRTIWLDEVADQNGRLALITGRFDLQHWLDGTLLKTLFLISPADPENTKSKPITPKNPSFARLRRIWETTQRFWQEVSEQIQGEYQSQRIRLQIAGSFIPDDGKPSLYHYHSYVLVKDQLKMSVLWDGSAFLSCDNLEYLSSKEQLGQPVEEFLAKTKDLTVYTPSEYGAGSQQIVTLQNIQIAQKGRYSPVIPILTEPNAFMMLVPAEMVLDVVEKIKAKYEEEMGKVRNRLPVHIGAVFAHRRTPLRAILDAGRAMLRQPSDAQVWKVEGKVTRQSNGQGQSAEVAEVCLKQQNRTLCWRVPLRMGDGTTEDQWYPYAFLKTGAADRKRSAKACNPWTGQEDWLVHASELKADDEIYFTPATFDFEFLDTNARRFEVHYNGEGRRPSRPTRPLYLDELTEVKQIWECLKDLSRRQRRQIIHSIEATRQLWYGHEQPVEDETFQQFVADTLVNAEWPQKACWKNLPASEEENSPGLTKESFIQAGCSGLLADVGELYMEILKA